jgi:two-component system phosphate regulon sensor histidine kinase PhoR
MSEEGVRILVVDDELGVREGCRKILSAEGFDVTIAEDGQAGLEAFEAHRDFAVMLVDLMMPRLTGMELMRKVRALDEDLVPIIITAHATIDTAVEGTKQGAYSFIPKPFTPDELMLAIKNGLERRALGIEARRLREERESRLLEVASERSKSNTIIKCMTDGILVINTERLIVLRNAAAARILPDCAARPIPFPLESLECAEVKALIVEILDAEKEPLIISREIGLGTSTFMVNVSPVIEPSGESSGAVAVFRDITALKKLETAKSMFVSMVAHEVKNPLAATEGWLALILSDMVKQNPEEERKMIQRSLLRIRTLRTLVSELLNLTAIETGNFTLRRSPVDISRVVREAVEANREKSQEKHICLAFKPSPNGSIEKVLADREALFIVFSNLIDNAIKYTPEKGHVEVRVTQDGMYLKVTVKDDGFGLNPEDKAKVFDEFFRAKNEFTSNIPGTGLGLSLVRRLTELHQGKVSVESAPGAGSAFSVHLPLP